MINIDTLDWEDKFNSPELEAWFQQFGIKYYLSGPQINELRDKVNELITEILTYDSSINIPYEKSIVPTDTPTGTGAAVWSATQPGIYTNFGGVVVSANSLAFISRDDFGSFSISQTALDLSTYAKVLDLAAYTPKTELYNYTIGKNKFNKADIISGFYITSAGDLAASATSIVSNWIPVDSTKTYYLSGRSGSAVRFKDVSETILLPLASSGGSPLPNYTVGVNAVLYPPATATHVQLNCVLSGSGTVNTVQLEIGTSATSYEAYVATPLIKTSLLPDTSSFIKEADLTVKNLSKNKINPLNILNNSNVQSGLNGGITYGIVSGWKVIYFPLEGNKAYTLSGWNTVRTEIAFYSGVIPTVFVNPIIANLISSGSSASQSLTKVAGTLAFTSPVAATWGAITVRTSTEADTVFSTIQLEEGGATSYTPYVEDLVVKKINTKKIVSQFLESNDALIAASDIVNKLRFFGINRDEVSITVLGNDIKVRTPFNQDYDLIHTWFKSNPTSQNLSSQSVYKIAKDDYYGVGSIMHLFTDNIAPFRAESFAIDSNHGLILPVVTMTSHGKTSSDLFSIWSDGTNEWYLVEIPTQNTLKFYGKKYATVNGFHIPTNLSANTLTHVSGAVNTSNINSTSKTNNQFFPVIKNQTVKFFMDGNEITSDGFYRGRTITMSDEHELVDIREVPLATPFVINNASTWLYNKNVFTYDKTGFYTDNLVDFRTDYYMNHYGVIQSQRMSAGIDSTNVRKIYLPNSNVYNSVDYRTLVNMATAPASTVLFGTGNVENSAKPIQRMIEVLQAAGVSKVGLAHGYFYSNGYTKTENRKTLTQQWEIRNGTGKSYPKMIENYNSSNQVIHSLAYFNYFDPTVNPNATSVYINKEGSSYILYIDYHQAKLKDIVKLPDWTKNLIIEEIDGNGGIVINSGDVVPNSGINITTSLVNGYAYGVYKLK